MKSKSEMKQVVRNYMRLIEDLIDEAEADDDLEFLEDTVRILEYQISEFQRPDYFVEH